MNEIHELDGVKKVGLEILKLLKKNTDGIFQG